MNSKLQYKIGTRGSLLALTQCTLIKNEMEQKTKKSFELKAIKTQGDQIQDKPLWQLDGKDFFTKELDTALLKNEVDLVVHSYKDLGSERPEGIHLHTISKRDYAHDILLVKKDSLKDISKKEKFLIGTSSPRRMENLTSSLAEFLPGNDNIQIECQSIRGNVNSRIEKLKKQNLDGIVLALAGLERLANKEESKEILKGLLKDLNFMILPQTFFPSAASQGALAIECLENASQELKETLSSVHDETTEKEMQRERAAFKSYGGGCHLAVGINVKKIDDYYLHIHKGSHDNTPIYKRFLEGIDYKELEGRKVYFMYSKYDFLIQKEHISFETKKENTFVTSSHCFHELGDDFSSLWSAGNRTMKKLIQKGHWVNGSAEGLGHEQIMTFKKSKAVNLLLQNNEWRTLSHSNADSVVGQVTPCYEHKINPTIDEKMKDELFSSDIIYWSSIIQYELYLEHFPQLAHKIHTCGLGKTWKHFKQRNIKVIPCIDMTHLKELV